MDPDKHGGSECLPRVPDCRAAGAFLSINGIQLHYLRFGSDGPALVIVPGITSPAATWESVCAGLARKFEVFVIDLRGRGLSSSGEDIDYGMDAHARDVAEFATSLGLSHYGILGHSIGGRIAVRSVQRFHASPDRLLLIDPPVTGPGRQNRGADVEWFLGQVRAGSKGHMTATEMGLYYPSLPISQREVRAQWIHTCDEQAVRRSHDDLLNEDFHTDLKGIDVPVKVLVAGGSGFITVSEQCELQDIKCVSTVRWDGVGHMLPWEEEERFIDFVSAHMSRPPNSL